MNKTIQPAVSPAPTFAPEVQELIDISIRLNRDGAPAVVCAARHALNLFPKKSPCQVIRLKRAEA